MSIQNVVIKPNDIILLGTTLSGQKFRPSDWAQRLTIAVSTVGPKKRIISHPHVHMAMIDGLPAVVVDEILEEKNKIMFDFLLSFAKGNQLQVKRGSVVEKELEQEDLRAVS